MKKILIVDDEPDILSSLALRLHTSGYEVVTAVDGAEAVRKTAETRPDIVLMDIKLPVIDGIEACRLIKSDPELARIPVVFLTADASIRFTHQKNALSADDYLIKPFPAETLLAVLRRLL